MPTVNMTARSHSVLRSLRVAVKDGVVKVADVAADLGVGEGTVYRWVRERGQRIPRMRAEKLAAFLRKRGASVD